MRERKNEKIMGKDAKRAFAQLVIWFFTEKTRNAVGNHDNLPCAGGLPPFRFSASNVRSGGGAVLREACNSRKELRHPL